MALRQARVLDSRAGLLRLQPVGEACSGCSSGCGGRCQLFLAGDCIELRHVAAAADLQPGEIVSLRLDDAQLRRAAWLGYGQALCGLLAGAALGHALGRMLGGPENLLAFVGLLLGTLLAGTVSKPPPSAEPRLVDRGDPSLPS